jgi:hypothetical protein
LFDSRVQRLEKETKIVVVHRRNKFTNKNIDRIDFK